MEAIQTTLFDHIPQDKSNPVFFNTTSESGETLKEYTKKAQSQDVKVLELFKQFGKLSPSEVWKFYGSEFTPITSIRRAITTLTKEGKLIKTTDKKIGNFSHPEYMWELAF